MDTLVIEAGESVQNLTTSEMEVAVTPEVKNLKKASNKKRSLTEGEITNSESKEEEDTAPVHISFEDEKPEMGQGVKDEDTKVEDSPEHVSKVPRLSPTKESGEVCVKQEPVDDAVASDNLAREEAVQVPAQTLLRAF
jgi:hypothetical protein